jgi:DNA replication protein DnaC
MESLIQRQLKNADVALGNKTDTAERKSVTTYDLAMLNGKSCFEISRFVEALKTRGHGAMCFCGAPGTGKTALAEHVAKALDSIDQAALRRFTLKNIFRCGFYGSRIKM